MLLHFTIMHVDVNVERVNVNICVRMRTILKSSQVSKTSIYRRFLHHTIILLQTFILSHLYTLFTSLKMCDRLLKSYIV